MTYQSERKRTIGVLGGMGPLATADFFMKLVNNTDALRDEEHIPVIINSDPNIPSRREAILNGGPSPVDELLHAASTLQRMGAGVIVMPCNTAHYFYRDIASGVSVPFLHMPELVVDELSRRKIKRACLLATDMTIKTGVYTGLFSDAGIETPALSPNAQAELMDGIFAGVKMGSRIECPLLNSELESLFNHGEAEIFVLACTELPILFEQLGMRLPVLDTSLVLARAAIVAAGGKLKQENPS